MKEAKEVRAVTIAKIYIAHLCLDVVPSEYMDLINKNYLKAANDNEVADYLEYESGLSEIERNECLFSYLEYKNIINFHETCTMITKEMLPKSLS